LVYVEHIEIRTGLSYGMCLGDYLTHIHVVTSFFRGTDLL
jgi:hypothetical protein